MKEEERIKDLESEVDYLNCELEVEEAIIRQFQGEVKFLESQLADAKAENKKLDKNWMNAVHRNVKAEKKFKALLKDLSDLVKEAEDTKTMTKQELSFAIEVIILTYMEI